MGIVGDCIENLGEHAAVEGQIWWRGNQRPKVSDTDLSGYRPLDRKDERGPTNGNYALTHPRVTYENGGRRACLTAEAEAQGNGQRAKAKALKGDVVYREEEILRSDPLDHLVIEDLTIVLQGKRCIVEWQLNAYYPRPDMIMADEYLWTEAPDGGRLCTPQRLLYGFRISFSANRPHLVDIHHMIDEDVEVTPRIGFDHFSFDGGRAIYGGQNAAIEIEPITIIFKKPFEHDIYLAEELSLFESDGDL